MKVLGLLLTLTDDGNQSSLEDRLGQISGLSLGDREGNYLAAVLEADTTLETDRLLDTVEQTPGVALTQVVGAYWDKPDGDEAKRLRGKNMYRKEPIADSLNGGPR